MLSSGNQEEDSTTDDLLLEADSLSKWLWQAIDKGDALMARYWLGFGADLEARDAEGRTPLIVGAEQGQTDLVRLLLSQGADVHAVDIYGKTALTRASEIDHEEVARLLRDASARE